MINCFIHLAKIVAVCFWCAMVWLRGEELETRLWVGASVVDIWVLSAGDPPKQRIRGQRGMPYWQSC
jgi:hypothetical protein